MRRFPLISETLVLIETGSGTLRLPDFAIVRLLSLQRVTVDPSRGLSLKKNLNLSPDRNMYLNLSSAKPTRAAKSLRGLCDFPYLTLSMYHLFQCQAMRSDASVPLATPFSTCENELT